MPFHLNNCVNRSAADTALTTRDQLTSTKNVFWLGKWQYTRILSGDPSVGARTTVSSMTSVFPAPISSIRRTGALGVVIWCLMTFMRMLSFVEGFASYSARLVGKRGV